MKEYGLGGANTTTGLKFEAKVELRDALVNNGYTVNKFEVTDGKETQGYIFKKHELYNWFLKDTDYKIDYNTKWSCKLLPDNAFYNEKNNTLYIVEVKFQKIQGSVDEKLQTCDFKKKQYERLLEDYDVNVKYCYCLSEWFNQPKYKDVLDYIKSVGCDYFIGEIPLDYFGLENAR